MNKEKYDQRILIMVRTILIVAVHFFCFPLFVQGNQIMVAQCDGDNTTQAVFIQKLERGENLRLICYGTSLTAAGEWVNQLDRFFQHAYPNQLTVINSGESGQHSDWGLSHFKARVLDLKPDVLFLEFAVNDAVERFHIPEERVRSNIETMITQVQAAYPEVEIVLQVTNPVIDRPKGHSGHRPNLKKLFMMVRDIAKKHSTLLIDHEQNWQDILDQDPALFRKYVGDGLHPNSLGCSFVLTPMILYQLGCISIETYQNPELLQNIIGSGAPSAYYTGVVKVGESRCRDIGIISKVPSELEGEACYLAPRGNGFLPGASYTIELEKDYTVYLSVHDRGMLTVDDWEKTDLTLEWKVHGVVYRDTLYKKLVNAGPLVIPPHGGKNLENGLYGVPHMCIITE